MARLARFAVIAVALVVFTSPVAECIAAASQMTQAESDCCEQMAEECGSGMDMPESHSCCTKASVQSHEALPGKAGQLFGLEIFAALNLAVPALPTEQERASAILSDVHGPPGISSKSLQALRI